MTIHTYFQRDIRLRHLRLLVAIDDAGQLTAAARKLHITQSALSKTLSEIERALGEPVFERTARGLIPTLRGLSLIRAARHTLAELERTRLEMQRMDESDRQTLMVGAMPTTAMSLLGAAVTAFMQKHPHITVRLFERATPLLLPELLTGKLDLVIGGHVRSAIHEGLQVIDLYSDPMVMVVRVGHPLTRLKKPTWDQCLAYPWVMPQPTNAVGISLANAISRLGLERPSRVIETVVTDTVLSLLDHSQAVAWVPQRLARVLVSRGLARTIGDEHAARMNVLLPVKIFLPRGQPLSDMTQSMISAVHDVLSGPFP